MVCEDFMSAKSALLTFEKTVISAMDRSVDEWRRDLERTVACLLEEWNASQERRASIAYAIGYCFFHMPGREKRAFEEAELWFKKAIQLDPVNMFSVYYLGCLYFEFDKPRESESYLMRIPPDWFKARDLVWREEKRKEILLCIRLILEETPVSEDEISAAMSLHYADPAEEVWPLPSELVATMVRLRGKSPVTFRRLAPVLVKELKATGLNEVFSDEISILRSGSRGLP